MNAALSQSRRLLLIVLAIATVVSGLNALQLVTASAASASPMVAAAAADGPAANITCDQGFAACAGSIATSGGNAPSTGGVITTPGNTVPDSNGFSFLLPCNYLVGGGATGSGSAFQLGPKYPINAKSAGEALASCGRTTQDQSRTQRTQPASGNTGSGAQPELCEPIKIDGVWTAAIGMINRSTAGWVKVAGSKPTRWTIHFTYSCVYPSRSAESFANKWSRYCLMNDNEFRVYYTQTASLAKAGPTGWGGGDKVSAKTGVDPKPVFKESTSKTCAQSLEDTWQNYKLPQANLATDGYSGTKYGFYRFSIHGYQILCQGQDPEAWTNNKATRECDPATKEAIYAHTNYTYTCNSSGFKKEAPDQSDAGDFKPAGCVNFTCDINPTLIANQKPSTDVSVLRNGEQTNTRIGNFAVTSKKSASGTGLVAGSVTNKLVKLDVVANSSPSKPGAGANDDNQLYRLMNQVTGQRISFGSWSNPLASNAKTPLKAGLIFYWASDPDAHWQMRQSYKFDAKYLVWRQDTVGGNAYLTPLPQTGKVCSNTTTSSEVTVLRSITKVTP